MSTYKISFRELRQDPQLSQMLSALERGLAKFDIDFFLIGAVARDVWMTAINGIPPSRVTGDIDFAIFIDDKEKYDILKQYLIDTEGFHSSRENAFVLVWNNFAFVDLLPFGAIESDEAKVSVDGIGLTSVNVPGFKEVYDYGMPTAELEGIHSFKFCTLPGIVILKLIAYEDRPEIRRDDIIDISKILKHFFSMYSEEIYENHNELFGGVRKLPEIAAIVMGREMSKIASLNPALYDRLEALLVRNTQDLKASEIGRIMVDFFGNTVGENVGTLKSVLAGFRGEI